MKLLLPLSLLTTTASAFLLPQADKISTTSLWGRKPFISGNWKLNPQTRDEAVKLAADIAAAVTHDSPDADVALFVPYVFIEAAQNSAGDRLFVGAEVSSSVCVLSVSCRNGTLSHKNILYKNLRAFALKSRVPLRVLFRPAC